LPTAFEPGSGINAPPDKLHILLIVFLTRTVRVLCVLTATFVKLLSLYLYSSRAVALRMGEAPVTGLA
jgi:hypothetical protein